MFARTKILLSAHPVVVGEHSDQKTAQAINRQSNYRARLRKFRVCRILVEGREIGRRPSHDLVPLDFTPTHLPYPRDLKAQFGTKGFMIATHILSSFASRKNRLTRALYMIGARRFQAKLGLS
jgi:hypothetical protein